MASTNDQNKHSPMKFLINLQRQCMFTRRIKLVIGHASPGMIHERLCGGKCPAFNVGTLKLRCLTAPPQQHTSKTNLSFLHPPLTPIPLNTPPCRQRRPSLPPSLSRTSRLIPLVMISGYWSLGKVGCFRFALYPFRRCRIMIMD